MGMYFHRELQWARERIQSSTLISPVVVYLQNLYFVKTDIKYYGTSLKCSDYVNLIVSDIYLNKHHSSANNKNHDQ